MAGGIEMAAVAAISTSILPYIPFGVKAIFLKLKLC